MGLPVSGKEGGNYTPAPEGNHLGICVAVIDLGTQSGGQYGAKRKVRLTWELPEERLTYTDKEGNQKEGPYLVSKKYNLTLGGKDKPSNLRTDLVSWRGKAFTPEEERHFELGHLLGAPALVSVVHDTAQNGNVYANVQGVARLPKGMVAPKPESEPYLFSFEDWDGQAIPKVSPKMLEVLQQTPEWREKAKTTNGGQDITDEDIPF